MRTDRVIVVGCGVGGLVTALRLAARGVDVIVVEKADGPGGKLREIVIGDAGIDAGPTVFTMRWVFDEIFASAGANLDAYLTLRPLEVLARHAWSEEERLDLFADRNRSADAIGDFAGAKEARSYRAFCDEARRIYETLEQPFIRSERPGNPLSLVRRVGFGGSGHLFAIKPFETMWGALGQHFSDTRLRQLFGRYATYCGSSPFLSPATLMLVAHVEQSGVWHVEGGMYRIALALEKLAARKGAIFRYASEVCEILVEGARATGVQLANGERIFADAVVVNADAAAVSSGRLGERIAQSIPPAHRAPRSLSAVTWALIATTEGFPLLHHTVFFSRDYLAEFDEILRHHRLPTEPTVYICAQDRSETNDQGLSGPERLFCLVNAPAVGDSRSLNTAEIEQCEERMYKLLDRCGLRVNRQPENAVVTTPADFDRLFPATGGALYGQASHGWRASFRRPGCRGKLPGLYLTGGSTHPGPGIPMAALSGRLAAESVLTDLVSIQPSRKMAISGGTLMR